MDRFHTETHVLNKKKKKSNIGVPVTNATTEYSGMSGHEPTVVEIDFLEIRRRCPL